VKQSLHAPTAPNQLGAPPAASCSSTAKRASKKCGNDDIIDALVIFCLPRYVAEAMNLTDEKYRAELGITLLHEREIFRDKAYRHVYEATIRSFRNLQRLAHIQIPRVEAEERRIFRVVLATKPRPGGEPWRRYYER
jgi:hypothetical protein